MSSLFPNFKTFLFQGKGVTGEVPFVKFDTDLKGLYLPATFTRPNSPEDPTESGATVIDADGTIRKLAEDEAPWSYPEGGALNGCLSLLNLPEKTNLTEYGADFSVRDTSPNSKKWTLSSGGVTSVTDNGFTADIFGGNNAAAFQFNLNGGTDFSDQCRFVFGGLLANQEVYAEGYIKINDAKDASGNQKDAEFFAIGVKPSSKITVPISDFGKWIYFKTNGNDGSFPNYGVSINKGITDFLDFEISYFGLSDTNFVDKLPVPTTNGPITRNSSQATFTDLVNKGVTSADGFSFLLDVKNYNSPAITLFAYNFKDGQTAVLSILEQSNGLNFKDLVSNTFIITQQKTGKILITFNGQVLKGFHAGSKLFEYTFSGSFKIDQLSRQTGSAASETEIEGFAPYVLPEATAAALTA